ncbi:hypothetical protein [Nocardia terpenica]|uniref:hypothetical protein n=1 Tax=Nocardia terpenica TaxID=455432 RepID=UPI00031D3D73|nr:hypothetical protein [Nocardia terpenica]NQE91851.1 hypothetical protein [Nocardia terpenica]
MSDWGALGLLLLASLAVSVVVYLVVVLWPQRLPKDCSVQEIRRRIEEEDTGE